MDARAVCIPLSMPCGLGDEIFNTTGTSPVLMGVYSNRACVEIVAESPGRQHKLMLATSNKTAVLSLNDPCHQAGQQHCGLVAPRRESGQVLGEVGMVSPSIILVCWAGLGRVE